MRNPNASAVAAICAFCAAAAFAGTPVQIRNAGFEEVGKDGYPVGWSRHPYWHGERAGHNGSGGFVYECPTDGKTRKGRPQQQIELKAGKRYKVSALVKADKIVTERPTPAQGVGVYIEGYGADGKWKFGGGPRKFASGTSRDWVKIEFITREVPEGLVRAYVQPWAKKCVSGRAVVDNINVEEYSFNPVEGVYPHVYRNESSGGMVRFHASLNADVRENSLSDYSAVFTYVAGGSRSRATAADAQERVPPTVAVSGKVVSPTETVATMDTSLFALGTNDVACTLFLKGKAIGSASAAFARLASPTRRRVYIDSMGRTIVDGKPFFPLGMYFRNKDATTSNLAVYAEGPFNCVMPYTKQGLSLSEIDLYAKAGLKVIFDLRYGTSADDMGKDWVHDVVPKVKDHPALLAWYTNDERPVADIPRLAARQKWIEALDPDHPTWSVQDVFSEARHYLGTYDVLGMDPYPIPKKPIETVISSMRQGVSGTFGTKAVWQVPQAFGWGWLKRKETKGQRAPTQKEMANMTWQSIAGGANGIVYYAFQHLYEKHDDPNDTFDLAWPRTKAAAAEIKKYEQVLLTSEKAPIVPGGTEAVAVRAWRYGGDTYVLAVNCTASAQTVTLSLPVGTGKLVATDFGPAPKCSGGKVHIAFGPIDYVMMRFHQL